MATCYVVMATHQSPVFIVIPSPKAVFMKKKDADAFAKQHNDNPRTTSELYVRKAELK